jgi:hypothetical protein
MGWQTEVVVQLFAGNTIINPNGQFVYNASGPGAGNLIYSVTSDGITSDGNGNQVIADAATTYAATFATAMGQGFVAFYSGSLAGGWTLESSVAGDVAGNLQVNATGQLQLVGSGGVSVSGSFSVNGSTSTGNGSNGGVTSGPSGTVNAFPAAGPNHTHAEVHSHTL